MKRSKPNRHVETLHESEMGFLGVNADVVRFGFGPVGSRMFRDFPLAAVDLGAYAVAIGTRPEDFDASCEEAVCRGKA